MPDRVNPLPGVLVEGLYRALQASDIFILGGTIWVWKSTKDLWGFGKPWRSLLLASLVTFAARRKVILMMTGGEAIVHTSLGHVFHRCERLGMWLVTLRALNHPLTRGMWLACGTIYRGVWIYLYSVLRAVIR